MGTHTRLVFCYHGPEGQVTSVLQTGKRGLESLSTVAQVVEKKPGQEPTPVTPKPVRSVYTGGPASCWRTPQAMALQPLGGDL